MRLLLTFLLIISSLCVKGQNSFQRNLYSLNNEVNELQKEFKTKIINRDLLEKQLDLTKRLNRLGEEVLQESIDQNIDAELAELIAFTCDFGVQKLNLLYAYRTFKSDFYLRKFEDLDNIYLSLFLKVKTKE